MSSDRATTFRGKSLSFTVRHGVNHIATRPTGILTRQNQFHGPHLRNGITVTEMCHDIRYLEADILQPYRATAEQHHRVRRLKCRNFITTQIEAVSENSPIMSVPYDLESGQGTTHLRPPTMIQIKQMCLRRSVARERRRRYSCVYIAPARELSSDLHGRRLHDILPRSFDAKSS